MAILHSTAMSGVMLLVVSAGLAAQTVSLNGQLLAEDTSQPLSGVTITVTSLTKPLKSVQTTTGTDGRFSVSALVGISYRLCSAATGKYAESCQFSKPLTVKASADMATVTMRAPAGVRMRVRVVDSDGLLKPSQNAFAVPDPLLLLVFAQEAVTSTRIPLQLAPSSTTANAYEASVVVPIALQWGVGLSSVRARLLDSSGNTYRSETPIPRPDNYGDAEFLAEFTLRAK